MASDGRKRQARGDGKERPSGNGKVTREKVEPIISLGG